jgi:hypothetical protein
MDLNEFWEKCFICTETVYPSKSAILRSLVVALDPGYPMGISYVQNLHQIRFNAEIANRIQSCNDVIGLLEQMHMGIHECLHAISFRKNDEDKGIFFLGLNQRKSANGVEHHLYYWLNECVTDYLAFDVMEKTLDPTVEGWRVLDEYRIIAELISIVKMKTLKAAYFEGRFSEMERSIIKKRKVNYRTIIQSLNPFNTKETAISESDLKKILKVLRS